MKLQTVYENTIKTIEHLGQLIFIGNNKSENSKVLKMQHDNGSRPIILLDNAFAIQFEQFGKTYIYSLNGALIKTIDDELNLYLINTTATNPLIYNRTSKSYNYLINNELKDLGFYRRIDISDKDFHYRIMNSNNKIEVTEFNLHPESTLRNITFDGEIEFNSGRTYSINKEFLIIPKKDGIEIIDRFFFNSTKSIQVTGSFALFEDEIYISNGSSISVYSMKDQIIKNIINLDENNIRATGPVWVNQSMIVTINVRGKAVHVFDKNNCELITEVSTIATIPDDKKSVQF